MDQAAARSKDALILFAHGSRDPEWAIPMEKICDIARRHRPQMEVRLAFLELMQPTLLAAIDSLYSQGTRHVTIAPAFLAPGAHVTRDLPELAQQAKRMYPSMTIRVLPSFGESEPVLEAIGEWVAGRLRSKERGDGH
jgi:sirohydrochlorin cobaltochelatase